MKKLDKMESKIERLNSPDQEESIDTNNDAEIVLDKEKGPKRLYGEIDDKVGPIFAYKSRRKHGLMSQDVLANTESPVLPKKTCLSMKKLKQPFRSPLKVNSSIPTTPIEAKKNYDTPKTSENSFIVEGDENVKPINTLHDSEGARLVSKVSVKKTAFRSPLVSSKNIKDPNISALYKKKLELERKIWEVDEHIKTIETVFILVIKG